MGNICCVNEYCQHCVHLSIVSESLFILSCTCMITIIILSWRYCLQTSVRLDFLCNFFSLCSTEECEVYGPIYREPDEKLNPLKYQRKHSGVRKLYFLFRISEIFTFLFIFSFRFFKESLAGGGNWSPRRPSSSGAVAEKPSEAVK